MDGGHVDADLLHHDNLDLMQEYKLALTQLTLTAK